MEFPILTTSRLELRAFKMEENFELLDLVKEKEVAATTLNIPHPCNINDVNRWLKDFEQEYEQKKSLRWAMTLKEEGKVLGGITLKFNREFESAELGYWVGKDYWGKGYATEAAKAIIEYGFDTLNLNRIEAHSMIQNEASSNILTKIGMQEEGYHRQLIKKWGEFRDVKTYGMLKSDWAKS